MAQRLPTVGGDSGAWGTILNGYLSVEHNADGTHNISIDASNVTFTPSDNSKWTGSVDPGNTNAGLDQLASRVSTVESGIGAGSDTTAIHNNVAGEINSITEKTAPVGGDLALIEDSADSNNKKKIQLKNIPYNFLLSQIFS